MTTSPSSTSSSRRGGRRCGGKLAAAAALALTLLLAAAAALPTASAQWVVETNSLRILEPSSVAGRHDAAIGDFGVPLYGATLAGEIRHVKVDACKPFPRDAVDALKSDSSSSAIIALVDRGDCFFIEKAFNAEKAGAAALIVADDRDEALVTMAAPDDRPDISKLKEEITIPTALVTQATGKRLKEALDKAASAAKGGSSSKRSEKVLAELDWTDAVAHPDARVEWELWSTPDDGCGASCDRQRAFVRAFERQAVELERGGFAQFTPRFVTRRCSFGASDDERGAPACERNCIHRGRYCSMAPVGDAFKGKYGGRDVAAEAKRQLCAFEAATKAGRPWAWWRFAVKAGEECTMRKGKFGDAKCTREALDAADIDRAAVERCVGDVQSDAESAIMESNLDAQGLGGGSSSRVLITPTVVINGAQYRGRLDAPSVTRGLCAGFSEATEPPACLTPALEVNECASAGNGGCWKSEDADKKTGEPLFSACVDTFRGFKCQCPFGFRGDGRASSNGKHPGCEDIDECAEGTDQCDQECENTPGGYTCSCREGYKQVGGSAGLGACFPADGGGAAAVGAAGAFGGGGGRGAALSAASFVGVVAAAAAVALLAGFVVHRGRARAEARAEVAAILRQYMPLEGDDTGGGDAGSSGFPFGRSRANTTTTSSSSAFEEHSGFAFASGAHHASGSGNFSSASEVGLTPTASSAEAEAEREAKEAERKEKEGDGGGAAPPPPSASNNV